MTSKHCFHKFDIAGVLTNYHCWRLNKDASGCEAIKESELRSLIF